MYLFYIVDTGVQWYLHLVNKCMGIKHLCNKITEPNLHIFSPCILIIYNITSLIKPEIYFMGILLHNVCVIILSIIISWDDKTTSNILGN